MGKKITLDFSKVEERSGWNTKEIPEGLHEFKIELVDLKDANDGTEMWTYGLRPTDPRYKTRLFPYYCKHQQNQYFKLRDIFIAAGVSVPKKKVSLDPDSPVGKIVAAEVSDATGQYAGRSEIGGVYDRSIIDDDDRVADEDDEDEVDEEAEEEEYEDEAEEADDEELREEIEGLTLAALRKRAKDLEIDTDGVKKLDLIELVIEAELEGDVDDEEDEDEDDLDDEDLDDEELEDEEFEDDEDEEEEEPEPAPRRRAAPAKKTPAKPAAKAAAAPARRVVKRR